MMSCPLGAIDRLDLPEIDAGANVVLIEPLDPVAFDRTVERDGLRRVAPSQLAVDLLTGPGREPSQGEQMLKWMELRQQNWTTRRYRPKPLAERGFQSRSIASDLGCHTYRRN